MVREKVGGGRWPREGRERTLENTGCNLGRAPWLTLNGCVIMASACTPGKITAYCGLTPSRRIIRVTMPPSADNAPAVEVYRVFQIITFYLDFQEFSASTFPTDVPSSFDVKSRRLIR